MNFFSFGGGVQSHAALVLASQNKLLGPDGKPYEEFIFANTGEKAESPHTLEYIKKYTVPFCESKGIKFTEKQRIFIRGPRKGKVSDLYEDITSLENGDISIPIQFKGSGFGNRSCTQRWKVEVIRRYIKVHHKSLIRYNKSGEKTVVGIGISYDEIHRMRDSMVFWLDHHYPLVDMKLTRKDCIDIINQSGLPVPPKSACWFCPLKGKAEWKEIFEKDREIFEKAVQLEKDVKKKIELVKSKEEAEYSFLTNFKRPLDEVKEELLKSTPDDDGEECTGYCMT